MAALMKISDVSKKYNITKRSLRYYEEIGLLKSIRNGISKSRYFDENEINRLEQILILRSIKFSINEISMVLHSDNTDMIFEIFSNRLKELNDKIDELNYSKYIIGSFIEMGKTIGINKVNIYQLLREQIYVHSKDERMINVEKSYEGDIIKLEFGIGILPLINPTESFLEMIKHMRNKLETELKRDIPLMRIMDNDKLNGLQYKISVKGQTLIDNDLEIVPDVDKVKEMVRYLESIIRANIDHISKVNAELRN